MGLLGWDRVKEMHTILRFTYFKKKKSQVGSAFMGAEPQWQMGKVGLKGRMKSERTVRRKENYEGEMISGEAGEHREARDTAHALLNTRVLAKHLTF